MSKSQSISVLRNYHDCDLARGSESYLPGLPTHAASCAKWCRHLRKFMILDKKHRKSKQVFRSYSAIMTERKRHALGTHGFIIHPFSIFAIYREHMLCILWMISFALDPYNVSFHHTAYFSPISLPIQMFVDLLIFINIILEFFVGYYVPITKEIVLEPKNIRLRYLRTYFFIDLFSCLPYYHICLLFGLITMNSRFDFVGMIKLIRIIRLNTMSAFMRDLFLEIKMGESAIKWVKIFLKTVYLIHWWACIFHGFPIMWSHGFSRLTEDSWLIRADLYKDDVDISMSYRYLVCLLTATSHFYGASDANQHFIEPIEKVMASICLVTGFGYCSYFAANFLQIFGSINIADSKYDELIYQLEEYSRVKKLPEDLQQRLKAYYEYKFQKKFFNQEAILNTLSEHLRYEILLFNCRHIIEKVMALQGLSKSVVGGLIANFKLEVYLQNDVIIKHGDPPFKMYFISHGTVAVFWSNGQELTHHEDGDFFGSLQEPSIVSVVAAEITETFSMDVTDARYIFKLEKEVSDRMSQLQASKQAEYRSLAQMLEESEGKSVLMELRRGYILEKRHYR
ncbi:potassium/sodium hyperpolarization-activated cyclic nucleotide-gated channel 3-like [Coccinella septempunctata]|uniref:potassium/sodium hyperpolarization-activated cyclic nucleotide-gated channel 3-like n=1 Tax=Coccinella septempunctata TaxID=41139 RepID=UPI001D0799C5|nr:potassium/sodium hyperpolarization-activated cyclic nucleotide-gated channel 3-like [Coccinella septempunctata]